MPFEELTDLVRNLLEDQDLRKQFHSNPIQIMDDYMLPDPLTNRDRPILFGMDREKIAEATGLYDEIFGYEMESDWSEQGVDWSPNEASTNPPDAPPSAWQSAKPATQLPSPFECNVIDPNAGSSTTRGGWSDPRPHCRGFRPAQHTKTLADEYVSLTIVGEGLLGSACITIHPPPPPTGMPALDPIVVPVEKFLFKNFRRVYVRTKEFNIKNWHAGLYRVCLRNYDHQDVPVLRGGHFFQIIDEK